MIKFFRKTRQKLLAEKKVGRYLAYALGEIVLVVIGILIALAINNKNQKNIEEKIEQTYLLGLKDEFLTSRSKLTELMTINEQNIEGAKKLLALTNLKDSLPTEQEFSKLLFQTFVSDIAFNPNNSLLNEIINSGNLKNIKNSDLRIMLTNWFATLEDISRQEKDLLLQRENLLDMFRTNQYSLETVFKDAGIYAEMDLAKGEETKSNLGLLSSIEFENKLLMFIVTSHATGDTHYKPLMTYLDNILKTISKELD
ncbi:DUF6090 family protein [Maribacter cobaltidurans]|uniref:Uncharacterized protein n=1 Tax=Maribacter cobaltidurans TaxID=1178778 RepID=A0A223V7L9_9FLAO|nr:DUF6090 family protein [Maribacter cobaltidurans]ASV30998.1 hypothetical protein CJ263_12655 [Maribacter cobaltidurans]GGD90383.1 hypothetical protein GCM10011412_30430 [Maribacter cobaltidurans]